MRDSDLLSALADLGDHVAYPTSRDLSATVVERLRTDAHVPQQRHRVRAFAVAAAILVIALLALPAPRHAVAEWLGITGVRVVRVPSIPADTGTTLRLGREVSIDEARAAAPFTLMAPSGIGDPTKAYTGEPAAGAVSLVWPPTDRLPQVHAAAVGLLLTEMPGSVEQPLLEKRLGPNASLELVTVGGAPGYWFEGGQHALIYLGPDGSGREDTTRLASNTLLWSRDGVVFRMESSLDRESAVELASHLEPL